MSLKFEFISEFSEREYVFRHVPSLNQYTFQTSVMDDVKNWFDERFPKVKYESGVAGTSNFIIIKDKVAAMVFKMEFV